MIELIYRKDLIFNNDYSLKNEARNPCYKEDTKEYLWKRNFYNKNNLIEKIELLNVEEAIIGYQVFEYDDKNRLVKNVLTHEDYEAVIMNSYEYIEDKVSGNKTEIKIEKIGDEFNQKEIIVKDSNDKIVKNELHDSYGLVFRFENIYNGKNLIKTIEYGHDGEVKAEIEYETDSSGNITKEKSKNDNSIYIELNVYDANNCLVESRSYKNDVEFSVKKYEYDKKIKLIKEEHFLNGELNFKRTYEYDANGNIIEMITNQISINLRRNIRINNFLKTEKKFDENNILMEELFLDDSDKQGTNICLRYART